MLTSAAVSPCLLNFINVTKSYSATFAEKFILLLLWGWKFKTFLALKFLELSLTMTIEKGSVRVLYTVSTVYFRITEFSAIQRLLIFTSLLTSGVRIDHRLAFWMVQNRHGICITELQSIPILHGVVASSHREFHLLGNASQKAIWRRKQKLLTDSSTHQ